MAHDIIIYRGSRYHKYDRFTTREEAARLAYRYKKERRTKYYIIQTEDWSGSPVWDVYFNKVQRIPIP